MAVPAYRIDLHLRHGILWLAALVARGLARGGVTPNEVTFFGLGLALAASIALYLGSPITAGFLFWASGSLDMVDGILARLTGRESTFGAFLDSVLDRVGEGALLVAVAYHFAAEGRPEAAAAAVTALFGAMLTSYVRARAEALGLRCAEGLLARPGRVILLVIGLLGNLLLGVVYFLAAATLWTSGQRVIGVYRTLLARG